LPGTPHNQLSRHERQATPIRAGAAGASGRFQVRYSVGEGQPRQAPATFATKDEAERYLAEVKVDLRRGTWFDADAGDIRLDV